MTEKSYCLEDTTGRNMDIKGDAGESSERKRAAVEKAFIVLELMYIVMNKMSLERQK